MTAENPGSSGGGRARLADPVIVGGTTYVSLGGVWVTLTAGDPSPVQADVASLLDELAVMRAAANLPAAGLVVAGSADACVWPDGVRVAVTRSAGVDGAVVVFVDSEFEPDSSDAGPGLRVVVNDDCVFAGVAYVPAPDPR